MQVGDGAKMQEAPFTRLQGDEEEEAAIKAPRGGKPQDGEQLSCTCSIVLTRLQRSVLPLSAKSTYD